MKVLSLVAAVLATANASHFDNIEEIVNFDWDHVMFKSKKDCALDNYPAVRILFQS